MFTELISTLPLLSADPFSSFRAGFASLMIKILGLGAMVTLIVVVVHIMQGDRESAQKLVKWLVTLVVGLVLFTVIRNI